MLKKKICCWGSDQSPLDLNLLAFKYSRTIAILSLFWVLVIWWFKLCKFIVFVVTHLLVQLKCYILADLKDLTRSWEKNYSFSDARSLCCVYMVLSTTIYKIYETNSSFHVKWHGKVLISIFQQFFATINNNFILGGGLGTRL